MRTVTLAPGLVLSLSVLLSTVGCEQERIKPPAPAKKAAQPVEPPSYTIDSAKLGLFAPLPRTAESKENRSTPEKVALGQMLFFDVRLSKAQDLSCNSCHELAHYAADRRDFSLGEGKRPLPRNTPSLYGAALAFVQFADGRAETVEEAAKKELDDPAVMGAPGEARLTATFESMPEYVDAFKKAFPDDDKPTSLDHVAKALGAYVRTLLAPSAWDELLVKKKTALTDDEKKGFEKFVDVGCPTCHVGALVGGTMYQKLGKEKPWPNQTDKGRSGVTKSPSDDLMFAVPSLRNVEKTGPYFHDASAQTLEAAVKTMASVQLAKDLPDTDIAAITGWLRTLTSPLTPASPPALPPSTKTTPKPLSK